MLESYLYVSGVKKSPQHGDEFELKNVNKKRRKKFLYAVIKSIVVINKYLQSCVCLTSGH